MGLLDVLAQLLQIFVDLIPRFARRPKTTEWLIVDSWLYGVQVVSRPIVWCPIFDHVEYWQKTPHGCDADIQTVVTADGRTITVNPAFAFSIKNPLKVREVYGEDEYASIVTMIIRGAIEEVHASSTWDEIKEMAHEDIIDLAIEEIEENGITIDKFCVEERAPSKGHRFWGLNGVG